MFKKIRNKTKLKMDIQTFGSEEAILISKRLFSKVSEKIIGTVIFTKVFFEHSLLSPTALCGGCCCYCRCRCRCCCCCCCCGGGGCAQ